MISTLRSILAFSAMTLPLTAGTVVVTSLPDADHPLVPLASSDGLALEAGTEIRVGAFPGMGDDAVLDASKAGGFTQVLAGFVLFGTVQQIGNGADGQTGRFEICVRQAVGAASPLVGQEICALIRKGTGQEFLVARFKGKVFSADPDTGLEPLISLHLAEAKILAGDRYGRSHVSTSAATSAGSFGEWIGAFTSPDPDDLLAGGDLDGDGRSNFLEYVTGGNPASGVDHAACVMGRDGSGDPVVRFSRAKGIGVVPVIEWSPDLVAPWVPLEGNPQPDPDAPASPEIQWLKVRVPESVASRGFFRLVISSGL